MHPINILMIYYWDKHNGDYLEYVLQKIDPLTKK